MHPRIFDLALLGFVACTSSGRLPSAPAAPLTPAPTTPTDSALSLHRAESTDAAPSDSIELGGTLPTSSGSVRLPLQGRRESLVQVLLPANRGPRPALILAFHGTGNEPAEVISDMDLGGSATRLGFVVIAPRAGYRDGVHPADIDHRENEGGSSWNLWDSDPNTNDDLCFVRGLIQKARVAYGIDTDRVYTVGFSNGAFFAGFAAARMSDRIAGFASAGGGATRCANIHDPPAFVVDDPQVTTCAALRARPGFPVCTGALQPAFSGRLPFGYISHFNDDDSVSVAWACELADALGGRARVFIGNNPGPEAGHLVPQGFIANAWTFLNQHTRRE